MQYAIKEVKKLQIEPVRCPIQLHKAHEREEGDTRQPAWHHQGNILPDQPGALL